MESLLVNFVYFQSVGHAIEALKLAYGYKTANPQLTVSILLNAATPIELAECCPFIEAAYPVDLDEISTHGVEAPCLATIPKVWDFIVTDHRAQQPEICSPEILRFHAIAAEVFASRIKHGYHYEAVVPYKGGGLLRLLLPEAAKAYAVMRLRDREMGDLWPRISVTLGSGSEIGRAPSLNGWKQVFEALYERFPRAWVFLIGASVTDGKRTMTLNVTPQDVDSLLARFPRMTNCFDLSILNQLAIIERCDLHLSPHTGMSIAAQTVGVPWLVISGGEWHEMYFNRVPFYSVPDGCPRYPCWWLGMLPECQVRKERGECFRCMTDAQVASRIPELLRGAEILLNREWSFERCLARHAAMLKTRIAPHLLDWLWFFDYEDTIAPFA